MLVNSCQMHGLAFSKDWKILNGNKKKPRKIEQLQIECFKSKKLLNQEMRQYSGQGFTIGKLQIYSCLFFWLQLVQKPQPFLNAVLRHLQNLYSNTSVLTDQQQTINLTVKSDFDVSTGGSKILERANQQTKLH